jgi:hypothetical protein
MQLTILYNWPIGEDSARVSLGMSNIEDKNYQFRLSILSKKDNGNDEWLIPGWVNDNEVNKLDALIKKASFIRVERINKETKEIKRYQFDCSKEWPPEASGVSVTSMSYQI